MNFERREKPEDSKQSFHGAGGARGARRRLGRGIYLAHGKVIAHYRRRQPRFEKGSMNLCFVADTNYE